MLCRELKAKAKEGGTIVHIEKFKAGQVAGLILHDDRHGENHSNEQIDPSRSYLNYNLIEQPGLQKYEQIMSDVFCLKRADVNTLVSIAITLPERVPGDRAEEFFQHCYNFLAERYGKHDNIVSAWVHNDESTPHMHFKFVPVYWNEKKQQRAISFDKVVPRKEYQTIHLDLENHIKNQFGIEGLILNGATANGNKTITELKVESLKEKERQLEVKVQKIESRLDSVHTAAATAKQIKPKKAPEPEIKKIPLVKDAFVSLSQYNELKEAYDALGDRYAKTYNGLQAAEVKIKVLEDEVATSKQSFLQTLKLQGEFKRTTERLEWFEGFYKATINYLKERLPEALERFVSQLPEQLQGKLRRDLKMPELRNSRSEIER